ncbi:MAG TPA: GntR family transcriptional regulator [Actinomycetales bacterium]|nr:GntR family transcriptional regulator [Actinomycetales bacterium]
METDTPPARPRFLDPVERESTPSIIARKLRHAIAHGELAPGAQLAEAELARELGVSRGPLREAMQRLTQEGLLLSIRNRGLFVIELTEADVLEIYVARTAVERAAAAQLVRGDHVAAGASLSIVVARMALAAANDDGASIGQADLEFHEELVRLSGSTRLIRMHQTLLTETRMCVLALEGTYPESDIRVPEHREIAAAITDGDAETTDRLIVAHMDDAVGRLAPKFPSVSAQAPARP